MESVRKHPDLFTEAEALDYLHLKPDAERTLKTLRDAHSLPGYKFGNEYLYHRKDLDSLVSRVCQCQSQRNPFVAGSPSLKMDRRAV